MKNRKLLLIVSLVLALTMSLGGTLAYLTDTDEAVNVMTLGNVKIEQTEIGADGDIFKQGQPLYPVYDNGTEKVGTIVKKVSVENTGTADAYIRTWMAFEAGDITDQESFESLIKITFAVDPAEKVNWLPGVYEIDGQKYFIANVLYSNAVKPGETVKSLDSFYMDYSAGNDDVAQFGNTYEVLVLSQGVQTNNMPGAAGAMAAAFPVTEEKPHPWVGRDFVEIPTLVVNNEAELREALLGKNATITLGKNITVDVDNTMTIGAGKEFIIDLAGYTLRGESDKTGSNLNMFDANGGTLTVKNGTIDYMHTGDNMEWNSSINIFDITAGGVLNLEDVTATVMGSDMAFVAHLNNWGEATLNVKNSTLKSNYVAVRVFNSGYDMNNVSIYDSTLIGDSNCFWVHNYTVEDFGTEEKAQAQQKLLNLDIKNGTNTFYGNIRYGYTNKIIDEVSTAVANEVYAFTAGDLVAIANANDKDEAYAGKTIKLMADIDLAGIEWKPINIFQPEKPFVFDGQGHTIYNMTISSGSDTGFVGSATGTIKNLSFDNAKLKTSGRSAIVAGKLYGNITNCHVKNSVIEDSNWAAGGIAGLYNGGSITNCSITNVTVKSNGGTGGIVGVINETAGTRNVLNCKVVNSTINNTGIYGEAYSGGGIAGMINIDNPVISLEGSTVDSATKLEGKYIYEICPPLTSAVAVVGEP